MALCPWTEMPGVEYTGLTNLTPRIASLLDLGAIATLGSGKSAANAVAEARKTNDWGKIQHSMKDIYIDVSQNPVRQPWTNKDGVTKCLTTSSMLYSYGLQRMLLPVELLFLQGHRRNVTIPTRMAPRSVSLLAGEGIFLPSLGLLVQALVSARCMPGQF